MLKEIFSKGMDGSKLRVAIVSAKFNEDITGNMLTACKKALDDQKVKSNHTRTYQVPGVFELPVVAKKVAQNFDVVICLGAVVRGDTPHFDYVAGESARGIMNVSLETGKPIIFGVITCDNLTQAVVRSADDKENKGWQAGVAAVEMGILVSGISGS